MEFNSEFNPFVVSLNFAVCSFILSARSLFPDLINLPISLDSLLDSERIFSSSNWIFFLCELKSSNSPIILVASKFLFDKALITCFLFSIM